MSFKSVMACDLCGQTIIYSHAQRDLPKGWLCIWSDRLLSIDDNARHICPACFEKIFLKNSPQLEIDAEGFKNL